MKFVKFVALVAGASAILPASAADWVSTGTTHWVNNQIGNDETGDGSEANPYATINKAASIMAKDDIVKIVPGKPYVLTETITNASSFTASPEYAHLTFTSSTDERVVIDGNGKCCGMLIGGRGLLFRNLCFTNCIGAATGNGIALGLGNADYGWATDKEMWRMGIKVTNCGFYACTNTYDETNTSAKSPAAFFAKKIIVEDCDFVDCYGGNSGGAVFSCNSCYEYFTNCTFAGNSAYGMGGAFYSDGYSGGTRIIDCTFTNNDVRLDANGGYSTGGALRGQFSLINLCRFYCNHAYGGGGAIYSRAGATHIRNSTFIGNWSEGINWYPGGGAVYFWDGGTVSNCWFESNSISNAYGGGVYAKGATFSMQDCTFTNNFASSAGAYYDHGSGNSALPRTSRVERIRFLRNKATGYGGAFYSQPSPLTSRVYLRNCLFAVNSGKQGGAVSMHYYSGGTALGGMCESCTFAGNAASTAGGAIYLNRAEYAVTNCLFSGNAKGSTPNDYYLDTSCEIDLDHCFMSADGDPKFVNAAVGDYTLCRTSPCANIGVPLDWMTGATDLRGKPRLSKDGEVDLGCYQFWCRPGLLLFVR